MGFFEKSLGPDESVFLDLEVLDFDYQPKLVPFRESHQFKIAGCIKPLFAKRPGKNLLIHGGPGVGKTVSLKHVLKEIEDEGMEDKVIPVYINCWKKDTSYQLALELCERLGYRFTMNKNTDALLKEVVKMLNKVGAVICLDEADKLKDVDALYSLIEDVNRKTIIFVTNDRSWFHGLDPRLKSRISVEELEFAPYSFDQVKGILKERCGYALAPNVLDDSAFELIVKRTFESKDVRRGLSFIREAGTIAEGNSSRKILLSHATEACRKLSEKNVKEDKIDPEQKNILDMLKESKESKLTVLYDKFKKKNPDYNKSYKTFKRVIDDLEKNGLIKKMKGNSKKGGNVTLVEYMS